MQKVKEMSHMVQSSLWEEPTVPRDEWLGCTVLYHGRERGQVTKALAQTTRWGILYECQLDGQAYPIVAYADELKRLVTWQTREGRTR